MVRKTGSKTERDALRREMQALGAGVESVADEMQRRFGFRPREAFRHAHGWSQEEAAERCNAATSDVTAGLNGTRISEYERWPFTGRRPTLAVLTTLAKAYGTEPQRLTDHADLSAMPARERPALMAAHAPGPSPAEPPVKVVVPPWAADPPDAVEEQDVIIAATEQASEFGAWAETTNVGPVTLAQIEDATRRIAQDYLTAAPMPLFMRTMLLSKRVFRFLQGRQQPSQTRELYLAAGRLYSLLAWMSGDLGYLSEAEAQGRTAWLCAELADHNGLRAWVLATQSKTAFWDGRRREAAALARRGLSLSPATSAAVMLACQQADAWAELGAADEALAALRVAEEARDRIQDPDDIGGLFSCGPARQTNYAASVNLRLGNPTEAIRLAGVALDQVGDVGRNGYGTLAQLQICAVHAHIMAGQLDGASAAASPVLALPPEQRLDPVTRRMREVGRALVSSRLQGSADAKALQDQVEDFCAASLPAQLPA